ncbi:MAG TPA: hypothetical protein VN154_09260 [Rhizomicrobium sp.]|nr:hypothetical protein [Rhizomicrobium sp.]
MTLAKICAAISAAGFAFRGGFHPAADEAEAGGAGTILLLGFVGRKNWPAFRASPEAADGRPDALDRWSRRVIGRLAEGLGARALFPFDGPPWPPFLKWAQRAEPVYPSPVGTLIHPDWGLWHAWRGALSFRECLALPERDRAPRPCDRCVQKPCLSACPVKAFSSLGFDVKACVTHIDAPNGADCLNEGCRARRACPVGAEHRHDPDEARFHMQAFRNAQR